MMRRVAIWTVVFLSAAGAYSQASAAAGAPANDFVVVCPIDGMIDDGVTVFVKRAVREAVRRMLPKNFLNTPQVLAVSKP